MELKMQDVRDLPKGIQKITDLPSSNLEALWHSIIVDEKLKNQLLSQSVLNFTVRDKIPYSVLPLHGVILLVGPPGTGKTSLAKGLANRTAQSFKNSENKSGFRLIEVDAHGLTSSSMGKTQREVANLFSQTIKEFATDGPTIVLLDEVETLAVDRSKLSLDANPVDIHRATDAVLVQLDLLAEENKNLLFIATSNFPEAVDSAFISRSDLVMEIPLPDKIACQKILEDCIKDLAEFYPNIGQLLKHSEFSNCISEFIDLDGRTIRKTVANALASNPTIAMDPEKVTLDHLTDSAREANINRTKTRNM